MQNILNLILTAFITATPVSYFAILGFNKLFQRHKKIEEIDILVSNLEPLLLTNKEKIRTIYYNDIKQTIKKERKILKKNEAAKWILASTVFCKFEKTTEIENEITDLLKENGIFHNEISQRFKIIQEIQHTEGYKVTTKVIKDIATNEIFAVSKGNVRALQLGCTKYFKDGKKEELTEEILDKKLKSLTENGEKILAFSYKPLPLKQQDYYTKDFCEHGMTLTGLIGSIPPINTNLKQEFQSVYDKKISKILITKEQKYKAQKIAKDSDFTRKKNFQSIENDELLIMKDIKLEKIIENAVLNKQELIFSSIAQNQEDRIRKTLDKLNFKYIHTSQLEGDNKIKTLINSLNKQDKISIQNKEIKSFILSYKISLIILLTTAIALKAPIPFTIGSILILEIFFTFFISLMIKTRSVLKYEIVAANKKPSSFATKSTLRGLALSLIYITLLISKGFNISETVTQSSDTFVHAHSMIFITLIVLFTFSAHRKPILKKENTYIILGSIISLLVAFFILTNPNTKDIFKLKIPNTQSLQVLFYIIFANLFTKSLFSVKHK